jgi:hypothetical protein
MHQSNEGVSQNKFVLSRAYEVADVSNSAIVYPHIWAQKIRAGMNLAMAVLHYRPFVACPLCGKGKKDALWIYWYV